MCFYAFTVKPYQSDIAVVFSFALLSEQKVDCCTFVCATRIRNFSPDLSYYDTRRALYRAFSVWSDATTLKFHEVQTGAADILIEFAAGYHHDGYPFDGQGLQHIDSMKPSKLYGLQSACSTVI